MESITLSKYAGFVHEFANRMYYEAMLKSIQQSAEEQGFIFIKGDGSYLDILAEEEFISAAENLFSKKRMEYLSPLATDSDIDKWASNDIEDGYSKTLIRSILLSLKAGGVYLSKRE